MNHSERKKFCEGNWEMMFKVLSYAVVSFELGEWVRQFGHQGLRLEGENIFEALVRI